MQSIGGGRAAPAGISNGSSFSLFTPKRMRVSRMLAFQCPAKLRDIDNVPVRVDGQDTQFPASPGVYAVYDEKDILQYVGISRKVSIYALCIHHVHQTIRFNQSACDY